MRAEPDAADGDDDEGDRGDKLGTQNRRQAHHHGANEHVPVGPDVATGVDQIKTDDERRAGGALGERMGVEIDELEPDGVQDARGDRAGEAGDVAPP